MLRKLAEKDEAKEKKDDIGNDKTNEVEIDKNGEVLKTENYKINDDVDKLTISTDPGPTWIGAKSSCLT